MQPVTLRTARLVPSAPAAHDVDAIFAACQDELIQRCATLPAPYERHHAEEFVAKSAQYGDAGSETTWAIRSGAGLLTAQPWPVLAD